MKAVNSTIIISTLMGVIQGCGSKVKEDTAGCKDSVYILAPSTRTEQYTCAPGQDISVPSPTQVTCVCHKEAPKASASAAPPSAPVEAPVVDSQPSP